MFCQKCGAKLPDGAKYCQNCGAKVEDIVKPEIINDPTPSNTLPLPSQTHSSIKSNKSKAAAALLAFFLGIFGAHNFYLGYKGRAIAQLLITLLTFFVGAIITSIWSFIEFILILTGSIKDSDGLDLQ